MWYRLHCKKQVAKPSRVYMRLPFQKPLFGTTHCYEYCTSYTQSYSSILYRPSELTMQRIYSHIQMYRMAYIYVWQSSEARKHVKRYSAFILLYILASMLTLL